MPLNNTIQKNAQSLKEKGAPQEVIDNYIKLAQQEKTGIEKTADLGKEVIRGTTGFLAAPVAMLSEGIRGLTRTKQSGIEKKLTDFAFEGTKLGTRERGGVALERATDAASLIAAPMTKGLSFGKAAVEVGKYGGKLGAAYGLSNSLQEDNISASSVITDTLLGYGTGSLLSVGIFGAGKGISASYNSTRDGIISGVDKYNTLKSTFKNSKLKEEAGDYINEVKKFATFSKQEDVVKRTMTELADFAMDINPHLADQLRESDSLKKAVIKQVDLKLDPNDTSVQLFKEMRNTVIGMSDDVSSKFAKVQDEILNVHGEKQTEKLSQLFIRAIREGGENSVGFDSKAKISFSPDGARIIFSPDSQLSKADQMAINKLFSNEFATKANTVRSLVNVSRIVDNGLPEEATSNNFANFKSSLGGFLRQTTKDYINDPKWNAINDEYGAAKDFFRQIKPLIGSMENYPNPVKLDRILNELSSTFRSDKNARQEVITQLSKKSGKNFFEALQANEILKDYSKRKGIASANNLASALYRVIDPGKHAIFTSTVTGKNLITPTKAIKSIMGGVGEALSKADDTGSAAVNKLPNQVGKIDNIVKSLLYKATDKNLPKATRLIFVLLMKELLYPTN